MSNLKIFLTLKLCSMCSRCRSMIRLMQAWQLFIWIYVANNDNDKWNEISSQQQQQQQERQKIVRKTEKHKIDGCLPFFSSLHRQKGSIYAKFTVSSLCAPCTHTLVKLHSLTSHVSSNLVIILMFMYTAMVTFEYSACVFTWFFHTFRAWL